jgi:predicted ATP-dependent endonuclease of OLD family
MQAESESRQRRSSSGGFNKFFQEVKQSETREKIITESKNFASKIGNQLKSVKDKATAAAAKLKDQNVFIASYVLPHCLPHLLSSPALGPPQQ